MLAEMWFQASGPAGILGSPIVMMVIVLGIFYVMLILPQQRQRKKMQQMLAALKAGDKVITNSGIYGTINGIDGETVILKIADQVKVRVLRSAIAQVEASEDAK
jgi:preprotein translocase subunit YajC